jgi:hypothetical protein
VSTVGLKGLLSLWVATKWWGLIVVGPHGRTSVPGVWAAGNVANPRAQVITAAIAIDADPAPGEKLAICDEGGEDEADLPTAGVIAGHLWCDVRHLQVSGIDVVQDYGTVPCFALLPAQLL